MISTVPLGRIHFEHAYPQLKLQAIFKCAFGAIEAFERVFKLFVSSFAALARTVFLAHSFPMLTDEQTSPEQFAALRAMTGSRRLRLAERLYWSARKMKAAGLHSQHPDWPEPRVNDEVRRIFSHART